MHFFKGEPEGTQNLFFSVSGLGCREDLPGPGFVVLGLGFVVMRLGFVVLGLGFVEHTSSKPGPQSMEPGPGFDVLSLGVSSLR